MSKGHSRVVEIGKWNFQSGGSLLTSKSVNDRFDCTFLSILDLGMLVPSLIAYLMLMVKVLCLKMS